jgi:CheY-like chemotaxis protein
MRRTVVVVSKDPKVHSAVKSARNPDLRVVEAPTGLGALFICASQPVDSLVIDLSTPGMNWPRLVEKLEQTFPGLPVFTLETSQADIADQLRSVLDSAASRKQPAKAHAALPLARVLRA